MRFVFLIPDLTRRSSPQLADRLRRTLLRRIMPPAPMRTGQVWGGTLNILRHCALLRTLGHEAVLATESGKDTYGTLFGIPQMPFIRWDSRRADDLCIVPDIYTHVIDQIEGRSVAYQQNPRFVKNDFDYLADRVLVWTDSPYMLEICKQKFPGKDIPIVPNIVDQHVFPFIPQTQRAAGDLIAFPRKGTGFIEATKRAYEHTGGRYWRFSLIDGLSFQQLAERFRHPQVFLASADVEGCALPPQEAMSAGIVVVGKNARGANYSMQHERTALVANTPREAAQALRALEDSAVRTRIAEAGNEFIKRFYGDAEPTSFWKTVAATEREFAFEYGKGSATHADGGTVAATSSHLACFSGSRPIR